MIICDMRFKYYTRIVVCGRRAPKDIGLLDHRRVLYTAVVEAAASVGSAEIRLPSSALHGISSATTYNNNNTLASRPAYYNVPRARIYSIYKVKSR